MLSLWAGQKGRKEMHSQNGGTWCTVHSVEGPPLPAYGFFFLGDSQSCLSLSARHQRGRGLLLCTPGRADTSFPSCPAATCKTQCQCNPYCADSECFTLGVLLLLGAALYAAPLVSVVMPCIAGTIPVPSIRRATALGTVTYQIKGQPCVSSTERRDGMKRWTGSSHGPSASNRS